MFAFDNMYTWSIPKLCNLLIESGSDVFKKYDINKGKHVSTWVIRCQTYDIVSVHDAPLELEHQDALELVRKLKTPGINDLISEISTNPNHMCFLRTNRKDTNLEDSVYLHETLTKLRKDKPFTLFLFQRNFSEGNILNSIPNVHFYNLLSLPGWNSRTKKWIYTKEWIATVKDVQKLIITDAINFM